jgi:putative transposase
MSQHGFRRTPGGVSSVGLHVVWCLKYRRRILACRVTPRCGGLLGHIAVERGRQIVAKKVMPDHVHLFVRVRLAEAAAWVVTALKGRTARILRQEFPYLRNHAKVLLWSLSYFAASVDYLRSRRCAATSSISGMRVTAA